MMQHPIDIAIIAMNLIGGVLMLFIAAREWDRMKDQRYRRLRRFCWLGALAYYGLPPLIVAHSLAWLLLELGAAREVRTGDITCTH